MIVDLRNKLVILGNRKCASSSLYNVFLPQTDISNPFEGGRPGLYEKISCLGEEYALSEMERVFFNRYFKHFTLFQAVAFFDKVGIDISQLRFLLAIRNPYERCLSEYKYWVRNSPDDSERKRRKETGVNQFLLNKKDLFQDSLSYFAGASPNVESNVHVVRVESLYDDLMRFFEANHLSAYVDILKDKGGAPVVNASPSDTLNLELSDLVRKYISSVFSQDFKIGGYEI